MKKYLLLLVMALLWGHNEAIFALDSDSVQADDSVTESISTSHFGLEKKYVLPSTSHLLASPKTFSDSTAIDIGVDAPRPKYTAGRAWQEDFSYMGIPFVISGLVVREHNKDFRSMRNHFMPKFEQEYDNYTQYVPMALTYALKLAGVKNRNSWDRMFVSHVFSAGIMAGLVNAIKYSAKEMRPDNSSKNSFPSGHTATAFMCATMLHKEYGTTVSPWFSIGGYTLAGLTGVTRLFNNRHWAGDILVGAGIGIISTDIGYFLADLIYKDKGQNSKYLNEGGLSKYDRPSFLSFGVGVSAVPSHLNAPDFTDSKGHSLGLKLKNGTATSVNAEGAYFFNPYIGVGGRLQVMTMPVIADASKLNYENFQIYGMEDFFKMTGLESDQLGMVNVHAGLYFSLPISKNFQIGTKLLIGRRVTTDFDLNMLCGINSDYLKTDADRTEVYNSLKEMYSAEEMEGVTKENLEMQEFYDDEFLKIDKSGSWDFSTGLSFTYAYKKGYSMKLYCDYSHSAPKLTYHYWNDTPTPVEVTKRTYMNNITVGSAISITF